MALIYRAELRPTKLELVAAWLPAQPWYEGPAASDVETLASFRFDDPAGAVGIETLLVAVTDGQVYQAPLTYRGAPLVGAEPWLVGTTEHSVLGPRWVYDACADPVYAAALASAVLADTGQAEQLVEVDGRLERREPTMRISAVGATGVVPPIGLVEQVVETDPTLIVTTSVELAVVRRLGAGTDRPGARLVAAWAGQSAPVPLAYGTPR